MTRVTLVEGRGHCKVDSGVTCRILVVSVPCLTTVNPDILDSFGRRETRSQGDPYFTPGGARTDACPT